MAELNMKNSFALARLMKSLNVKDKVIEVYKKGYKDETVAGADLIFTMLEACGSEDAESEFYRFMSLFLGKTQEEIESKPLFDFVREFMDAVNVKEWLQFFRNYLKD